MSTPLPEIPRWKNYDPVTGIGDPSTPFSASVLNPWTDAVEARTQEAVDRAEAGAAAAEGFVTDGVDAATANNLESPDSQTRAAFEALVNGPVVDGLVAELVLDTSSETGAVVQEYLPRRVDSGVSALYRGQGGLSGSPKAGNILVGAAFQTLAPFVSGQHNNFPALTLCLDGTLLAVWRKGTAHGIEVAANLVQSRSADLGATWTAPTVLLSDSTYDQRDPSLLRLGSGRLALTYYKSNADGPQASVIRFSDDHGATWSPEITLPFSFTGWVAVNGVTELADGTLLAYGYGKDSGETYAITRSMRSTDGGANWGGEATIASGASQGFNEVCVDTLPNGTVMALVRSDDVSTGHYRSISADGGASWSAATKVINGWGRPEWIPLASGGLVAFYRGIGDNAPYVTTSWDDGLTWATGTLLHSDPAMFQSVYMQAVEVTSGLVAVVYCDELSTQTGAVTRFRYLMDGVGFSPLGDARITSAASNAGEWTALTPATNWRAVSGDARYLPAYRLNNGMVELRPGLLQPTVNVTPAAGGSVVVSAALPANVRPAVSGARSAGTVSLTSAVPTLASYYVDPTSGVLTMVPAAAGTLTANGGSSFAAVPYMTWPAP